jgi:hypothetical protein
VRQQGTFAHSSPNNSAVARPISEPPPVISAALFSTRRAMTGLLSIRFAPDRAYDGFSWIIQTRSHEQTTQVVEKHAVGNFIQNGESCGMSWRIQTGDANMREPRTETDQRKDERVGSRALLGAAVAVLILYGIGLVALGTPPGAADTGEQVTAWFRAHRDGVCWYVWGVTVSLPPFAVMFALLHRLLPSPHREVFLIGAVTFVTTYAVQAWTWGGLALHADRLEPATARTVLDIAVFWGPVLTGATTTMIAPVTLLALRGHAGLPRWLGALGAVAFVEQAIETITIFGSTGFTEPGGAMNLQLGAGLTATWMLAFAVWAGIRGRAVAPTFA